MPTADELLAMVDPTEGPLADVAERLRHAIALREQLNDLIPVLEAEVIDRMETDVEVIPHVGRLVRTASRTSKWRDGSASLDFRRDVFRAIEDEVSVDQLTGTRDEMRQRMARMVLKEVDDVLPAFSSLKQAGRARLRIDVDQYREFTSTYKVVIQEGIADE